MWTYRKELKKGKRNTDFGLECQDYAKGILDEKRGRYVVTLADGSGVDNLAYEGAKLSSGHLCTLLIDNFDRYIGSREEVIRQEVYDNIRAGLLKFCAENECSIESVHSTLLGVVADEPSNRFIAIHLGDGEITYVRNGKTSVLSFPENGVNKQYTYLTSLSNPKKHLRIYMGSLEGIDSFMLVSDGYMYMQDSKNISRMDSIVDDASWIELTRN